MRRMNILITGFEPFDGDPLNPSALLVEHLAATPIAGATIRHAILPCAFAPLEASLRAAIEATRPDLLIGFGLATGRTGISLERVAINVIDARIPDNLGAQPIDEPVAPTGPAAYFSTLPIKAALQSLLDDAISAAISQTAGTYVCNALFYHARHIAESMAHAPRAGFIHVPCLPEMQAARDGAPSLDRATMHRAGMHIIETCLACNTDLRIAAGTVA